MLLKTNYHSDLDGAKRQIMAKLIKNDVKAARMNIMAVVNEAINGSKLKGFSGERSDTYEVTAKGYRAVAMGGRVVIVQKVKTVI